MARRAVDRVASPRCASGGGMIQRNPRPALRPFVATFWATERGDGPPAGTREHVLPTGAMHLAIRLGGAPLRVYEGAGHRGRVLGPAVVGGARSTYYVRDAAVPSCSVGAMLRPGASRLLFGAGADELAERHTPLGELWGHEAARVLERLLEADTPQRRIDVLEGAFAARLDGAFGAHAAVTEAIELLRAGQAVRTVVKLSGFSHRHLLALFRRDVGLAPKAFARVLRFRRALTASAAPVPWSRVALAAGYSDQAHFVREFRSFAGVTPTEYRRIDPALVESHVPVAAPR